MAGGFDKQPSSRIIKHQNLVWTSTGAGPGAITAPFAPGTQQIRVISQVAGFIDISNISTLPTSAGTTGMFIPASTTGGEYFTVTPGMILSYASTSTSSGLLTITEMG